MKTGELEKELAKIDSMCDMEARVELSALIQDNFVMKEGLQAIRALISESDGIAGLHPSGDVAPWEELEEGGRFEEWLLPFNKAEAV